MVRARCQRGKRKDLFKTEVKITTHFIKSKTENGRNKFVRIQEDKSGIFGYKPNITFIDLDDYENHNPNENNYSKPKSISGTPLTKNSNTLRASSQQNISKDSKILTWRKTKKFLKKNQWRRA